MIRKLGRSTRPEIAHVKETDLKATKRHASAFGNPEFGAMLKREGCDALLIVGPSASGCVLGTCWSAFDWDVHPYHMSSEAASHLTTRRCALRGGYIRDSELEGARRQAPL